MVLGSVLLFLAVIVSLIVYWQLRYTGITMSNETFCGYEEHVHTEECYDEEGNLICELEEHTHTVDCLINLNADVEDATVWKATLPELTGDLRTDVVNIAYSQLGYTESTAIFSPGEDGVTRYGYTRYGAWYGNEYGTWDAMFVSFCLNYAGVDRTVFPLNSGAYSWAVELSEIGSYAVASAYTPLAGDIAFFDSDYDGRIDRVGIVASTDISGGVVTIIEGDYTVSEVDTVCEHIYALNDPTISGYGIIAASEEVEEETEEAEAEETAEEIEETEESEEIEIEETEDTEESEEETVESPTLFYTASDSGVNVTVIAPEGALPDGAALAVTLLDEESDEYAEAAEAVGYESTGTDENAINAISEDDTEESEEVATALAVLDISFTVDGETVEPTEAVTVIIDASSLMTEDADTSTLEVQHLEETPEGITPVLVADATDETEGTVDAETAVVEFTTESFSTFTLKWNTHNSRGTNYGATITVNIYTSDDGTNYTLASGDNLNYSLATTISNSLDLYVSTLTANVTGLDDYDYVYATMTYKNNTYGSSTDPLTCVSSRYSTSGFMTTTYSYTPTYYTENNTSGTALTATTTTSANSDVTYFTINLYYAKSSASITIEKYETGTTTQLSGAMFTLTSDAVINGVISSDDVTLSFTDNYTATFTTNGDSITITDLPDGSYTLTETSAPDGYELASGTFSFTVSGNSITSTTSTNSTYYVYDSGTVNVYDDPKTVEVYVNKVYVEADGSTVVDASETSGLTATFTLNDNQSVSVTGANTSATAFKLRYDTTYTLSETTAPSDYAAVSGVTITVDSDGGVSVSGSDYASVSGNTITITNKKTVSVTVEKVYVDANGDVTTSGIDSMYAVLTVTDSSGSTVGTGSDYGVFDFEVTGLTDGTYTLSETAAGGYTAVGNVTITVSNGEISISTVDNVSLSDGVITVTNEPDDDHPYAGMTFAIANLKSGNLGALTSSTNSSGGLTGVAITYETDSSGNTYIESENGDDITLWTFVATSTANVYYITDGNGNYLRITGSNSSGVSTSTSTSATGTAITVTDGDSTVDGKVMLSTSYGVLNCYNTTRFDGWNSTDNYYDLNNWQTLCLVKKKDGLYITDDLISSGEYIATLVVDGVEVNLTDPKYTVTWYKAGYAFDSSYNCYVDGSYSEVTNSEALGDNNSTVNVAIDQGGLCYYYVTVSYYDEEKGETVTLESEVEHVPYAAELLNCSFEWNSSGTLEQGYIPFWSTTSSDSKIEIGSYTEDPTYYYGTNEIYAGGSAEAAGDNFAELNANNAGSLYQDVLTIDGESLYWSFYHRARTANNGGWYGSNAEDTMYVVIMSTEEAEMLLAGIDQSKQQDILTAMIEYILEKGSSAEGTDGTFGTYTLESGTYAGTEVTATIWTLSSTNTYQEGEWDLFTGTYTVPDEQYVTRFFFVSGSTATNDATVGNLIDYATFSQNITYVIEYWTINNNGTYDLASTYTQTGSAYPYTLVSAQYLSEFSNYGLVGSVTGTKSGGSNPVDYNSSGTYNTNTYTSMLDQYTTTSMRVTSSTMYLSLYLDTPVVAVVKVLEGLDDVLTSIDTQTITFNIIQVDTNALAIDPLYVTVGNTGTGSSYTGVLSAGKYTISESDYNETITVGDVDYALTGVTVTISDDSANLTDNGDGTYSFDLEVDTSLTITFTNTYAEVVTGGPEMPQTGGRGTKLYTMVGLLLICSGGYLLYRKQRRKCKWRWNI